MGTERFVAFLRAVNVGKRRMEMATLRDHLAGIGLEEVTTYIASGNACFRASQAAADLEPAIEACLRDAYGFEVETFVRSVDQVRAVVALEPFEVPDGFTHLVAFLRSPPTATRARAIEALATDTDQLVVDGAEIHWRIEGGSQATELKPRDWRSVELGVEQMTTRNITMLTKLVDRLGS